MMSAPRMTELTDEERNLHKGESQCCDDSDGFAAQNWREFWRWRCCAPARWRRKTAVARRRDAAATLGFSVVAAAPRSAMSPSSETPCIPRTEAALSPSTPPAVLA